MRQPEFFRVEPPRIPDKDVYRRGISIITLLISWDSPTVLKNSGTAYSIETEETAENCPQTAAELRMQTGRFDCNNGKTSRVCDWFFPIYQSGSFFGLFGLYRLSRSRR